MSVDTKSPEWEAMSSTKIREVFELFDKDKTEAVVQEEVGTMMRYLGAYPTERQLVLDILPGYFANIEGIRNCKCVSHFSNFYPLSYRAAMQNDEPTGFVNYSRFEKKMLEILRGKTLEPDSSDVMLQVQII